MQQKNIINQLKCGKFVKLTINLRQFQILMAVTIFSFVISHTFFLQQLEILS